MKESVIMLPIYIDSFLAPVRDNPIAQVAIAAVLILIVLDILFGLGNAVQRQDFSSAKMRAGIAHKSAELGFILVGIVADGAIIGGFDLGFPSPVLLAICIYLALMEIGSLCETFAEMNPALAAPLSKLLASVPMPEEGGDDA